MIKTHQESKTFGKLLRDPAIKRHGDAVIELYHQRDTSMSRERLKMPADALFAWAMRTEKPVKEEELSRV